MKRHLALATLALAALAAPLGGAEPISRDQVAKLQALIRPAAGEEKWQQIPWQVDLWKARQQAAAEGKPILLWEMDGHPLGCT
jgi:hypothetical protein